MTPLNTADLRHRITIRRGARSSDGKGGYTTAWTTIATAMAEVRALDGRESVMEHVLEGVSVYRIRIRFRAGLEIRASDQVQLPGGAELNVTAPASDPDGMREQLVILASSASALGTA